MRLNTVLQVHNCLSIEVPHKRNIKSAIFNIGCTVRNPLDMINITKANITLKKLNSLYFYPQYS